MGNGLACLPKKDLRGGIGSRSRRGSYSRSQRKTASSEEELLHHQALAMAIHHHQLSQRFDGSMSRRIGSTSSRRRDLPDSVTNGKLPPAFLENLETRKIILVHGEGFGAWCWYKTMSLLEESGLLPVALDLTGSGIDQTDINSITSLEDYARPLITCLQSLPDDEKVILVGHSCGGAIVSYALESYPRKVSKAVYVCATMVLNGQKPFDVFSEELASADLFLQESQFLVYGNGRDKPPTSIMFDKQQIRALYFNQSPPKDVALATVSMRPIPLAPIMEKLSLTTENYGTVRRYFIQTLDDRILSLDVQERLVRENAPHGMYKIKGSDHCPFFSKPQTLNKILTEIVQIPLENALNDPS
ncbi:putative methylesterase 14, chloroplastic [Musa acuminata AAA Group]|uniref:putative methylesterase 14, chloroplastic n=1 Tax=Musa acuminata AAA Group TaxID=214697 RepID=UPI0031DB239D